MSSYGSIQSFCGFIPKGLFYRQKEYYKIDYDEKIILWDKVQASEIELPGQEPNILKYSVHVEWVNSERVLINGRIVDIDKGYDYRRE